MSRAMHILESKQYQLMKIIMDHQRVLSQHVSEPLPGHVFLIAPPCPPYMKSVHLVQKSSAAPKINSSNKAMALLKNI